MRRHKAVFLTLFLLVGFLGTVVWGMAPRFVGPIYDGPELDYQPAIIRVEPSGQLMVVFERINLADSHGDLWATFSDDNGTTWSAPQAIIASTLNERHPSLIQLDVDSYVLFYLVDETGSGSYRIHRATSADGLVWTPQGRANLGWATAGEINPHVIREENGDLTMVYHRLSGPSYLARSVDDGVTWDTLMTQVSNGNAQLPRLAKRERDGLYLVTYQVGSSDLDLFAKVTSDPYDWSDPQIPVSTAINTHDSQPMVLEDGTFLVPFARQVASVFDLFYRTSCDGVHWSEEVQVTDDPAHYDTQPHPLLRGALGDVILTWSHQESVSPYQDHDVWVNNDIQVEAALSGSEKRVEPSYFAPGRPLTYTVVLVNSCWGSTMGWLTDTVPLSTTLQAGSLWASGGEYGFDPASATITWTGTISSGGQITLGFRVDTDPGLPAVTPVSNTAQVAYGEGISLDLTAIATTQEPISGLVATNDGPSKPGSMTTLTAMITAGSQVSYSWVFGDGDSGSGAVVSHIYPAPGEYSAVVTASNEVSVVAAITAVVIEPHAVHLPFILTGPH